MWWPTLRHNKNDYFLQTGKYILLFSSLSFKILINWTFLSINCTFPSYARLYNLVVHLNLEIKRELWATYVKIASKVQHQWRMSPTPAHSLLVGCRSPARTDLHLMDHPPLQCEVVVCTKFLVFKIWLLVYEAVSKDRKNEVQ